MKLFLGGKYNRRMKKIVSIAQERNAIIITKNRNQVKFINEFAAKNDYVVKACCIDDFLNCSRRAKDIQFDGIVIYDLIGTLKKILISSGLANKNNTKTIVAASIMDDVYSGYIESDGLMDFIVDPYSHESHEK
jgi:hypothetical protein